MNFQKKNKKEHEDVWVGVRKDLGVIRKDIQ